MAKRIGFGQVEPNHLANQSTKQSYAQLPAADNIEILENGQFARYNYAQGEVNFADMDKFEPLLVWNEIKLYDGWRETVKDFALIKKNYTKGTYNGYKVQGQQAVEDEGLAVSHYGLNPEYPDGKYRAMGGQMYPRLIKTEVGDIITTNCFATEDDAGKGVEVTMEDLALGNYVAPNAKGYLAKVADATGIFVWQVVKVYTMPDGQWGVKIQRVK